MCILQNKIGIICGVHNRLGNLLMESFEKEGAQLLLVDHPKEALNPANHPFFERTSSEEKYTLAYLEEAQRLFGGLHVLVLNEIIPAEIPLSEKIKALWQEINPAIPQIAKSGGGSIIIISSQTGTDQAAIAGLVRSVATETAKLNIRINMLDWQEDHSPVKEAKLDKIAETALFLAGDESTFITGSLQNL